MLCHISDVVWKFVRGIRGLTSRSSELTSRTRARILGPSQRPSPSNSPTANPSTGMSTDSNTPAAAEPSQLHAQVTSVQGQAYEVSSSSLARAHISLSSPTLILTYSPVSRAAR